MRNDTIAAIATAWGEAGIAIVRLSGGSARELAEQVLRLGLGANPFLSPRVMCLASLLGRDGSVIDRTLAVYFKAPHSYTGEDVVEIHTHGGTLTAQLCLEGLIRKGAVPAEPGEFTMRAFLNGRIDLSQAESVLGIIRSRSEEALKASARTLSGELSVFASDIREEILTLQTSMEAELDFPEDLPGTGQNSIAEDGRLGSVATLRMSLSDLRDRCSVGLLLREGIRVAVTGRPNVGKSSLLNALLKQARAIVTAIPGTTRDVIEETVTWQGVPIRLADTAGLRILPAGSLLGGRQDEIEAMGIERTLDELKRADICLWVLDSSKPLDDEDKTYIGNLRDREHIIILNKSDLDRRSVSEDDIRAMLSDVVPTVLPLSAKTGEGIEALKDAILSMALGSGAADSGLNVTARQLAEISEALSYLTMAEDAMAGRKGQDIAAGLLGSARECLERLLGLSYDDALLDSVFSHFCVGK